MRKTAVALIAVAVLGGFGPVGATQAWAQVADTVLVNGKIITLDSGFSIREALAVRDGTIVAVGGRADIRSVVGPDRKSTRLNSSHIQKSRMPSSA